MRALATVGALGLVLLLLLPLALVWQFDAGSVAVGRLAHEARLMLWVLLAGVLAIAGVVAGGWALREVVRAWRAPVQLPPERHVIQRETRVIDGRPVQLPQISGPWAEVWPELVRAGQIGPGQRPQLEEPAPWDGQAEAFEVFADHEDWQ